MKKIKTKQEQMKSNWECIVFSTEKIIPVVDLCLCELSEIEIKLQNIIWNNGKPNSSNFTWFSWIFV